MFKLRLAAYCGMSVPMCETNDRDEARKAAADALWTARRAGLHPTINLRGKWWEINEPADCAMVPDNCGQLFLERETRECRECGTEHDTQAEADECCAERDVSDWDYEPNDEDFDIDWSNER